MMKGKIKRTIRVILFILMLIALTSCKGTRSIQSLVYVTALGVDYVNNEFIIYAQALNFLNVAKSESFEIGKPVPIWIGVGKGKTITTALADIYKTSQLQVYWGHIRAIIISENAMKDRKIFEQIHDGINRYREVRYNVLLYGTKESMIDILSQKSVFNFSPLDSTLDNPQASYRQDSRIPSQYSFKILAEINEPGRTGRFPSIGINKKDWLEDKETRPMFIIDGLYFMGDENFKGWYPYRDLEGLRWLTKTTKSSRLIIPDNDGPEATLTLYRPRYNVKAFEEDGRLKFNISINVMAYISNIIKDASIKEMENKAEQRIEKEVRDTFTKGLGRQTDILNLRAPLFRKNKNLYKKLKEEERLTLHEDSLKEVKVKVHIVYTGKYKGTTVR